MFLAEVAGHLVHAVTKFVSFWFLILAGSCEVLVRLVVWNVGLVVILVVVFWLLLVYFATYFVIGLIRILLLLLVILLVGVLRSILRVSELRSTFVLLISTTLTIVRIWIELIIIRRSEIHAAELTNNIFDWSGSTVSRWLNNVALLDYLHEEVFKLALVHVLNIFHVGHHAWVLSKHLGCHSSLNLLLSVTSILGVILLFTSTSLIMNLGILTLVPSAASGVVIRLTILTVLVRCGVLLAAIILGVLVRSRLLLGRSTSGSIATIKVLGTWRQILSSGGFLGCRDLRLYRRLCFVHDLLFICYGLLAWLGNCCWNWFWWHWMMWIRFEWWFSEYTEYYYCLS